MILLNEFLNLISYKNSQIAILGIALHCLDTSYAITGSGQSAFIAPSIKGYQTPLNQLNRTRSQTSRYQSAKQTLLENMNSKLKAFFRNPYFKFKNSRVSKIFREKI